MAHLRPRCAVCNGQLRYLGRMSDVDYYRCLDCDIPQGIDAPIIRPETRMEQ